MVSAQTIVTYTPYCCNAAMAISAQYFSRPAPIQHYWTVTPSNSAGVPSGPAIHQSSTFTGGNGNYSIPSTVTSQLCGGYALLTLYVLKQGTPNYYVTFTSVIYVNPTPVVTGPSPVCGTGTYCVTNLTGTGQTYYWEALSGSTIQWSANTGTSNCVTIPAMFFNNVWVTVTDANGCQSSSAFLPVTNNYIDANFYISNVGAVDAGHFKFSANRPSANGAAMDVFTVQEVDITTDPFTVISGTTYTNANWSNVANWYTPIYFFNYDADFTPPWTSPTYYALGHFTNGRYYRVTRTIDNGGCVSTYSLVVNQSGVYCYGCRQAGTEVSTVSPKTATTFEIFPNPNNGAFTVQLNESAENAQAELVNLLGEKVDAFTFSGTSFSYSPAQTFAPGVYLLRVTNNGVVSSKRIVVQ